MLQDPEISITRREDDTLQEILRIFYSKLKFSEKIFLYIFLIDIIGYILLFITYLLVSGDFFTNIGSIVFTIFPVISGITMVNVILFIN